MAQYPRYSFINGITNAQYAEVSFTAPHDFTVSEIVGFRVDRSFGMYEINRMRGKVLSITETTITVDIDTTNFNAFDYSSLNEPFTSPPVCVPSASGIVINNGGIPQTSLIDAFDNRP